jgi:hypothetical protein
MPPSFIHRGERFDRVTILFKGGPSACQARAFVQDALHRAHGFRTATNLTDKLAKRGGRFRVAIARHAIGKLKRRLKLLIKAGMIRLFVAGQPVAV